MPRRPNDALLVLAVALVARLGVVVWAQGRFPAVADGHYYDLLAHRLVSGAGYTWLWPDGAVTYAAHYPVGYPALEALGYAVFGGSLTVAMCLNAVLGAAGAVAAYVLVDGEGVARWRPLGAGLAVAAHPALLTYVPSPMTEAVTGSLLLVAAALAGRARSRAPGASLVAAGVAMGVAILVRPQSLLLAPAIGALAAAPSAGLRARLGRAVAVSAVALACVAPWTARNCVRMHHCALVSVNEGWNLLIGVQTDNGGWEPVGVPPECATVWDEAAKDGCFDRAARRRIAERPGAWLARAPAKLAMTFDYFGAGPWYLHASNPAAFDERAKLRLGAVETVVCRLLLLGALVATGRLPGPRPLARKLVALAGAVAAVSVHGWYGYAAWVACVGLLGGEVAAAPLAPVVAAAVALATGLAHAVFFGAGRYGLVVVPFVTLAAFARGGGAPRTQTRHGAGLSPELRGPGKRRTLEPSTPLGRSPVVSGHARLTGTRQPREESPSSTEHDAG